MICCLLLQLHQDLVFLLYHFSYLLGNEISLSSYLPGFYLLISQHVHRLSDRILNFLVLNPQLGDLLRLDDILIAHHGYGTALPLIFKVDGMDFVSDILPCEVLLIDLFLKPAIGTTLVVDVLAHVIYRFIDLCLGTSRKDCLELRILLG